MQSVTSNAVAEMFNTGLNDADIVDITSQVTKYLGVTTVKAFRKNNIVQLYIEGNYTGSASYGSQTLIKNLPQKYRPIVNVSSIAVVGYKQTSPFVVPSRVIAYSSGTIQLGETAMSNGSTITFGLIYIV